MARIAFILAPFLALLAAIQPVQAQAFTLTIIDREAGSALDYALDALTDWQVGDEDDAASALAIFGPFRVIDPFTAEMHGTVDSDSPDDFAAMRAAYPELRALLMIECPGSDDDAANLVLARMVRAARIDTIVPAGGSVRSGAVELFLAGVRRQADSRAEFAVHSWRDDLGREADDLSATDPVHREYLDFYRDMGLSEPTARQFYALTNSVSFDQALYLHASQLASMGLLDLI